MLHATLDTVASWDRLLENNKQASKFGKEYSNKCELLHWAPKRIHMYINTEKSVQLFNVTEISIQPFSVAH